MLIFASRILHSICLQLRKIHRNFSEFSNLETEDCKTRQTIFTQKIIFETSQTVLYLPVLSFFVFDQLTGTQITGEEKHIYLSTTPITKEQTLNNTTSIPNSSFQVTLFSLYICVCDCLCVQALSVGQRQQILWKWNYRYL